MPFSLRMSWYLRFLGLERISYACFSSLNFSAAVSGEEEFLSRGISQLETRTNGTCHDYKPG